MQTLDLSTKQLEELLRILAVHVPGAEVMAYGSRVNGTSHDGSDLDLVIRNPTHPDQPQPDLHRLRGALEESNLPIFVEVLDWARIPPEFRAIIESQPTVRLIPAMLTPR